MCALWWIYCCDHPFNRCLKLSSVLLLWSFLSGHLLLQEDVVGFMLYQLTRHVWDFHWAISRWCCIQIQLFLQRISYLHFGRIHSDSSSTFSFVLSEHFDTILVELQMRLLLPIKPGIVDISKDTISRWLSQTICITYQSQPTSKQTLHRIRPHKIWALSIAFWH